MTKDAREKRIALVKRTHPEAFKRVRSVCVHASVSIDLDHHAAQIVMAGKGKA